VSAQRHDGDSLAPSSAFQRRSWTIQRVGWLALSLWLVASAVGWIGPGPGSRGRAGTPDRRISVHYDRVLHLHAPTRLVLLLEREQTGALELALAGAYAEAFRLHELVPGPRAQSAGRRERRFALEIDRTGPTRVELALEPLALGWQAGEILVDGQRVATLRHLVLP
jgi:hypothetical protein